MYLPRELRDKIKLYLRDIDPYTLYEISEAELHPRFNPFHGGGPGAAEQRRIGNPVLDPYPGPPDTPNGN